MAAEYVCDRCGEVNPIGTVSCVNCHAFLAWDQMEGDERREGEQPTGQKSREPRGVSEQNLETRVAPRIRVPVTAPETDRNPASPTRHSVPTDSTEGLFRITAEQREVVVPATGEPAVWSLRIMNTSAIVDGYAVEAASAPRWLQVESIQIRLLPDREKALAIRMRVAPPSPVPAQRVQIMLGIRSMSQAPAHAIVPVVITVPVLDVPIRLHAEPTVLRVRDRDGATCTVVVDNSSSNHPVQLRFAGSDPELAVGFRFEPPVLEVGPAASASVVVTVTAARPGPGQQISRALTVSAHDGSRRVDTVITFVQAASASPMSTLGVRIEPSIVRVQDADGTTLQVILDNRRGHSGIRLFLDGSDPERATRATFSPAVVDLGPGQVRAVSLRLDSWRPPPGQEWTRQFTVTASDGYSSAEALGSLVQSSSRAAIETLAVRLDPSVLRLSGRRGGLRALIDNRNGTQPIRVTMRGDDPENIVRFTFAPGILDIPPGQVASSSVTLTTSWAPAGEEVTRPFVILGSDGRFEVEADGSIIQSSAERRPLARLLLTLFGALAMILGALLPWWAVSDQRGVDLNVDSFAQVFGFNIDLRGAESSISVGLVIMALAILMIFGLTGRSGRLSGIAALLGAMLIIGTFVAVAVASGDIMPARGAILALAGCIAGCTGGLLVER
jgi:hypothetical protein